VRWCAVLKPYHMAEHGRSAAINDISDQSRYHCYRNSQMPVAFANNIHDISIQSTVYDADPACETLDACRLIEICLQQRPGVKAIQHDWYGTCLVYSEQITP